MKRHIIKTYKRQSKISTSFIIFRKKTFPCALHPSEGEQTQKIKQTGKKVLESGELTLRNTAVFHLDIFCAFVRRHLPRDRVVGRDSDT